MRTIHILWPLVIALLLAVPAFAQAGSTTGEARPGSATGQERVSFEQAMADLTRQLEESLAELSLLREQQTEQKIPLSRTLAELEAELVEIRQVYQQKSRLVDSRALDLTNLKGEIKSREDEVAYLSNLLGEYIRNFESRLHIAELKRYESPLQTARLAVENSSLTAAEVFEAQAGLLSTSIDRLEEALGGTRFQGTAVNGEGLVAEGTFALVGPVAMFRSADGRDVGIAEQRLGSLEPAVITFANPEDATAVARLIESGVGTIPLDPSLGNAHRMEATQETLWEHVQKGGPIMVPIFIMAAAALSVALYKWIVLALVRRPSKRQVAALLDAVSRQDADAARKTASEIKGPVGEMLRQGVDHLGEPREIIEEVMYETVLKRRLSLQSMVPFIAVCAASAPLLGLLGTVTGIINTFKMITVFGSSDVKLLSGGISEALVTTEYGLIVAIPSLLLHAYLSRKVKGVVGEMETHAVGFVNATARAEQIPHFSTVEDAPRIHEGVAVPDAELVQDQVHQILREMLGPLARNSGPEGYVRQATRPG